MGDSLYGLVTLVPGAGAAAPGCAAAKKYSPEARSRATGTFMRFTKEGLLYMAGQLALIIGFILLCVISPLFFL